MSSKKPTRNTTCDLPDDLTAGELVDHALVAARRRDGGRPTRHLVASALLMLAWYLSASLGADLGTWIAMLVSGAWVVHAVFESRAARRESRRQVIALLARAGLLTLRQILHSTPRLAAPGEDAVQDLLKAGLIHRVHLPPGDPTPHLLQAYGPTRKGLLALFEDLA